MTNNLLFAALNKDKTMKNIAKLEEMISNYWYNNISSLGANKVLKESVINLNYYLIRKMFNCLTNLLFNWSIIRTVFLKLNKMKKKKLKS